MLKKIIIILILVLLIIAMLLNAKKIYEYVLVKYISTIKYDVKIESSFSTKPLYSGYGNTTYYYLVDLENKILYKISNNYVSNLKPNTKPWEWGDNYSIKKRTITDKEKQEVLNYYNYEENFKEENFKNSKINITHYWKITFKDKIVNIKECFINF